MFLCITYSIKEILTKLIWQSVTELYTADALHNLVTLTFNLLTLKALLVLCVNWPTFSTGPPILNFLWLGILQRWRPKPDGGCGRSLRMLRVTWPRCSITTTLLKHLTWALYIQFCLNSSGVKCGIFRNLHYHKNRLGYLLIISRRRAKQGILE